MHSIKTGWVWKANGAGETDYEGTKGQFSDAFKRAAVMWGIGRYLYALPNEWVQIKPSGKSYKIVNPPKLPDWAIPANKALKEAIATHQDTITAIKDGIAEGDLSKANEAWHELSEDEMKALWAAPSKGGPFSTKEREIMKSTDFRTANGEST